MDETIAGVLMDADITATELKILMADIEFAFDYSIVLINRLVREEAAENLTIPTILLSHTEMTLFEELKKQTTDENNNEAFQFPYVTEHMLDLSIDEDDVAMNDIIDSD